MIESRRLSQSTPQCLRPTCSCLTILFFRLRPAAVGRPLGCHQDLTDHRELPLQSLRRQQGLQLEEGGVAGVGDAAADAPGGGGGTAGRRHDRVKLEHLHQGALLGQLLAGGGQVADDADGRLESDRTSSQGTRCNLKNCIF